MPAQDHVSEFLRNVRELDEQTEREDAQRAEKLQQDILEGRRQRQAMREERQRRSPSPPKLPSRRNGSGPDRRQIDDSHDRDDRSNRGTSLEDRRERDLIVKRERERRYKEDYPEEDKVFQSKPRKALLRHVFKEKVPEKEERPRRSDRYEQDSHDRYSRVDRSDRDDREDRGSDRPPRSERAERFERERLERERRGVPELRKDTREADSYEKPSIKNGSYDDYDSDDGDDHFRRLAQREKELRDERRSELEPEKTNKPSPKHEEEEKAPSLPQRPRGQTSTRSEGDTREQRLEALRQLRNRKAAQAEDLARTRSSVAPRSSPSLTDKDVRLTRSTGSKPASLADVDTPILPSPRRYDTPEPDQGFSDPEPESKDTAMPDDNDDLEIELMNPVARSDKASASLERSDSASPSRPSWLSSALNKTAPPRSSSPRSTASAPLPPPSRGGTPSTVPEPKTERKLPPKPSKLSLKEPVPLKEREARSMSPQPPKKRTPSPDPIAEYRKQLRPVSPERPDSPVRKQETERPAKPVLRQAPLSPSRSTDNEVRLEKSVSDLKKAPPPKPRLTDNDARVEKRVDELRPVKPRDAMPAKPTEASLRLQGLKSTPAKEVRVASLSEALKMKQNLRPSSPVKPIEQEESPALVKLRELKSTPARETRKASLTEALKAKQNLKSTKDREVSPERSNKGRSAENDFASMLSQNLRKGPPPESSSSSRATTPPAAPAPRKVRSVDDSNLPEPELKHLTKTRPRGPKGRKLPKDVSAEPSPRSTPPTSSATGTKMSSLRSQFENLAVESKPEKPLVTRLRAKAETEKTNETSDNNTKDKEDVVAQAKRIASNKKRPPPRPVA